MNTVIEKVNNMGKQLQDILVKMKEKTNEMNIWIAHQGFKFSPEFKAKNI